ncbi:MAG: SGNH/GDSL hydrolase family protein, partial [Nitrososphaera sp.]|nr:SGNH/GDSL hydrolase family protein [Nitrososphaera sp.]
MQTKYVKHHFRKKPKGAFISLLVFLCLGALALYWSEAPEHTYHTLACLLFTYLVLWGAIFLWSTASKVEQANRFLLTGTGIALSVALLELLVVAGILDFRTILSTPVYEPWHHPDNLLDPTLLHIHKPHDRWLWYDIDYRYDQYGLRNDSDLNTADVVVVGDSLVEGLGVSSADLLTTHLTKHLHRSVANLGQSWYGPQQELELLRRYGLRFTPKVCVWVFFDGNDLADMSRYRWATQDWETFSKDFHSFRQRSFTKNAILALNRLLSSIHTQKVQVDSHETEKDISGVFSSPSGRKTRLYFHNKGRPLSSSDHSALQDLRSILRQAHNFCHAGGAQFLVVFAPTKFRVYKDFIEFDPQAQPRYWVTNNLPKEIEAIVHEDLPEAGFLDLTTALVEQVQHRPL